MKKFGKFLIFSTAMAAAVAGTLYYLKKQDRLEEDLAFDPDDEDPYDDSYEVCYSGDGDLSGVDIHNTFTKQDTKEDEPAASKEDDSYEPAAAGDEPCECCCEVQTDASYEEAPDPSMDNSSEKENTPAKPAVEHFFDDED